MAGFLSTLTSVFREQLERNRNRPFLRATMAASALVAMADGRVTFPEQVRVDQILETLEALKVFDPHEGVNLFNGFADAIRESSKAGRDAAVRAIEPVARDPETAALILRICLAKGLPICCGKLLIPLKRSPVESAFQAAVTSPIPSKNIMECHRHHFGKTPFEGKKAR